MMGFDFGTKRIGVAIGQTITKTARPLETLAADTALWDNIHALIKRWQPEALVVGIPLNMDGTEQPITAQAKQFAKLLHERCQLPVYNMDERLSTVAAREHVFQKGGFKALKKTKIDSVAAQLILEHWLTIEKHL